MCVVAWCLVHPSTTTTTDSTGLSNTWPTGRRATVDSQHVARRSANQGASCRLGPKRPRYRSGADLIASKSSRSVPGAAAALETYVEARRSPAPAISALPPPTAAIAVLDRLRQRILGRDRSLAVRPNRDRRCGARRRSNQKQRTGHNCGFADHTLHPPVGMPPPRLQNIRSYLTER